MKRRDFIKQGSAVTAGIWGLQATGKNQSASEIPPYHYPQPNKFDGLFSQEGLLCIRLAVRCKNQFDPNTFQRTFSLESNGEINRIRYFAFPSNQLRNIGNGSHRPLMPQERMLHVFTIWIQGATPLTRLNWIQEDSNASFSMEELFEQQDLHFQSPNLRIHAKFLLDHEIGKIDPASVGIQSPASSSFTFVAGADPQGGNPFAHDKTLTRMRIHNAFTDETVDLINRLKTDPSFVVMVGDITDGWGTKPDFEQMHRMLSRIKAPLLYTIGNHESPLHQSFDPGYRMEDYDHYFAAQKQLNGLEKLLYSFDLGGWHFVFWPDPLRDGFWENHPHYFDWLERDLEQHKTMPSIVFQHVPTHPIGIDPLIWYCEPPEIKKHFLDTLTRHGNVKLVLSGHVHIPVKASIKTMVNYQGIHMINLPAAGYRPRACGEADICDGPAQGAAIVELNDDQFTVTFKTLTEREYVYPANPPRFDEAAYAPWLIPKYQLPASKAFINGNFKEDLQGWSRNWVYPEDVDPSNICEVRYEQQEGGNRPYLHLCSRKREFETPGQDRLPQSINQITQALDIEEIRHTTIQLQYRLPASLCDLSNLCGSFLWVEGFQGSAKCLHIAYASHWLWANFCDKHSDLSEPLLSFQLPEHQDQWMSLELSPVSDWQNARESHSEPRSDASKLDRLVFSMGLWTINQGERGRYALEVRNIRLKDAASSGRSNAEGQLLANFPQERIWWRNKFIPNQNLAGEHRYHLPMKTRF